MSDIDQERLWFLRGVLAALASSGQVTHYDEIRRLCRLNRETVGEYLGEARAGLRPKEPDFCAIVVAEAGRPGEGFGSVDAWHEKLRSVHNYWRERRYLDNPAFEEKWGDLPTLPGLPDER